MPRIRQYAEKYTDDDFRKVIRHGLTDLGYRYDSELAEVTTMSVTTACRKVRAPSTMSLEQLRSVIAALDPDPVAVLRFLGYSMKDIRRIAERLAE